MSNKIILLLLILSLQQFPQANLDFNGYLQNMQTVWSPKSGGSILLSNSANNRFNISFYYENLRLKTSMRNILDYGQFVGLLNNYQDFALQDEGYINLTKKISSGNSYIFYFNFDRLNLTYTLDNLEFQIGRQRINWGINYVWTPNDIFNSASFINFDYVEKPGSDAIRVQYYFGYASSFELVAKINSDKKTTIAGKLGINFWDYDFQILGGLSEKDYILGGGWSGNITGAGFTGEFSYFKDRKNSVKQKDLFVGSVGTNYMFSNSLFLSFEFLYNSIGKVGKSSEISNIFNIEYSARNLSPARYSVFGQLQYPFTPLINGSVATIINPTDGSLFLSPSLEISLNEDVFLLGTGQFFIGEKFTEWGEFGQFYYLRIKWNF